MEVRFLALSYGGPHRLSRRPAARLRREELLSWLCRTSLRSFLFLRPIWELGGPGSQRAGRVRGDLGRKSGPALSEYGGRELRSLALAFGREQGKWGLAPENVQAKLFNFVGNAGKQTPGVRLTRRSKAAGGGSGAMGWSPPLQPRPRPFLGWPRDDAVPEATSRGPSAKGFQS